MSDDKQQSSGTQPKWVAPLPTADLRAAAHAGRIDASSKTLLEAETRFILGKERGGLAEGDSRFAALALSGGGIRSATFCLGVLQALADQDLLQHFRYLSTVSGGGYIGAALTWWLGAGNPNRNSQALYDRAKNFPFGRGQTGAPEEMGKNKGSLPAAHLQDYLRQHGDYLTPEGGKSLLVAVAAVLRSLLLNAMTWFPIVAALYYVLLAGWLIPAPEFGAHPVAASARLLIPAVYAVAAFLVASVCYSLATFTDRGSGWNYWVRRAFERSMGTLLLLTAVYLIAFSPPVVAFAMSAALESAIGKAGGLAPAIAGFASAVAGAASALKVFRSTTRERTGKAPPGILAAFGSALFLYGVLLTALVCAGWVYVWAAGSSCTGCDALKLPGIVGSFAGVQEGLDAVQAGLTLIVAPLVLLAWGLITGWFVNLNYINLHRFYRDRLMEAFMPGAALVPSSRSGAAYQANRQPLASAACLRDKKGKLLQPYPLINANIVLARSRDQTRFNRGGDSFLLSPLYCGSNATGWQATKEFNAGHVTLPTAMAISGAAVNPGTGVGGSGVTRNYFVSLLLAWLNLRLGYWLRKPTEGGSLILAPDHFIPGLYDLGPMGYRDNSTYMQLSDGGHFENLGLYELVRRRAGLIVCCDAGQDEEFGFGDLQNAALRIEQDFGAHIQFEGKRNQPESLAFPRDAKLGTAAETVKKGFIKGTIHYADGKDPGTLFYVKPTLIDDLPLEVTAYHKAEPEFPNQSTIDQWFDPAQFEAYRKLGYAIGQDMLAAKADKGGPDVSAGIKAFAP